MYALRERRVHVTQEDFELAVAKVSAPKLFPSLSLIAAVSLLGDAKGFGEERLAEKALEVIELFFSFFSSKSMRSWTCLLFVIALERKKT